MASLLVSLFAAIVAAAAPLADAADLGAVRIDSADREFDLSMPVVVLGETLRVANVGSAPVASITLCVSERLARRRSFFEVAELATPPAEAEAPAEPKLLEVSEPEEVSGTLSCSSVALRAPLRPQETIALDTYAVFTKVYEPRPAEITQRESQRVLFKDHLLMVSPYSVASQVLKVVLPGQEVEDYTASELARFEGDSLIYGPFPPKGPWQTAPLSVHFEHNHPFVEVPRLEREIIVSHWGAILVEENYVMRNGGALHTGPWSRSEFDLKNPPNIRDPKGSYVGGVLATLPAVAQSAHFRDKSGSYPTFSIHRSSEKVEAVFEPSYPLFGGWTARFVLSYWLPVGSFLSWMSSGRLRLAMRLACPIEDAVVEELTVKVVLPEGAHDIVTSVPFSRAKVTSDVQHTFLDTIGRSVRVIRMTNVVAEHNVDFEITYSFSMLMLAQEPLLLAACFMTIFFTAIVGSRLEWAATLLPLRSAAKSTDD